MASRKNRWVKRIIAAGMTVSMVLTSTVSVLAESMTENNQEMTEESITSDEIASEPAEKEEQTESTIDEEPEVQLSLELIEEEEAADSQKPSLTLTGAENLSEKLKVNDRTIEVTDGEGLILLSNVKPEEYYTGYTIQLITTSGWDLTQQLTFSGSTYSFLGLGDETHPYEGGFKLDTSTSAKQYSIMTSKAVFNALSTKAELAETIPFSISESTSAMTNPLLAEKLKSDTDKTTLKASIVLRNLNAEKIKDPAIGGLIGTLGANASAKITFTNQFPNELTVSAEKHTGLFCNTMETGSSLTAVLKQKNGAVKVAAAASEADAGGFVGHMEADSSLTVAGCSVNQVSSDLGNAGGLVGSSIDGTLCVASAEESNMPFTFSDTLTLQAATGKAAGGLIGAYSVENPQENSISYDLSHYTFKNFTISGGQDVGGLFGLLNNTSTTASQISINLGNTANVSNSVSTAVSASVTNFGGLIGKYQSFLMANTLSIKGNSGLLQAVSTGGTYTSDSYGGIVGTISESSYVEIENVSASTADMKKDSKASFGGLAGKINDGLLNVGNVTLTTTGEYDLAADDVDGRGGLVGHLVKGVLRLHGTTDLSRQKITTAYNHTGQIVGNNGNGLVYATGNGNSLSDSGEGWKLIRYLGQDRSGSDIGNWGAVVRLGGNLKESSDGVLSFDVTTHTVRINNGVGTDINNANAFAAYALAFDLSNAYASTGNAALSFATPVNPSSQQSVTLTGDIDLTGTGILGIGKDSFEKNEPAQRFQGTFEGGSHTITLDIGTTYGASVSTGDNAAGQLYAKRSDQRDAHYSLALIPFAGAVAIQNLTIAGTVNGRIPHNVKEEENSGDIRYPAFVSAAIGLAGGKTDFENMTVNTKVSVTEESDAKKLHVWQSGFLGRCESKVLTFKNCIWGSDSTLIDERDTDNQRIGGLAAEVMGGCTVTVENCTLSGSITSKAATNARVGGLIAVSRGETQSGNGKSAVSTIHILNLKVNGETITAVDSSTSGGLLGYQWKNTNVIFAASADNTASASGVTISGSTLTANAQFGGLVYQATGYWNATAANSIIFESENGATTFTGKSTKDTPSGLLVGTGLIKVTQSGNEVVESALYLEAGTWGNASDAAYKIDSGAVVLNIENSEYFDELVGTTKKDDAGNSNAVVSLAVRNGNGTAERIDTEGTENTYTGQLGSNYKNGNTRYYYNLDSYRKNNPTLNVDSITSPEDMVLWSVAQYAAVNIRDCFRQGEQPDVIITGSINLKGYSYYPVTPLGAVNLGSNQAAMTSVTFDYDGMNAKETNNKPLSDSDHQHYLMQHGLFYHTTHNIAVKNTSFSGTVGKERTADGGTYSSGALIYGSATGDPVNNNIVEIILNNVTLAGIRVTGIEKDGAAYAPLLINQMNQAVKLTVNALSTGDGYTTGDGSGKTTAYAASSLIGKVGSAKATKLTLSFSNIALDGRLAEDETKTTAVQNNGKVPVEYHTTHTIFTRATLLESFMYSSEGSGTYNFNSTDNKVTYGVELTNTGTTGRNPDKQYQYYDSDSYITDEQNQTANEEYVKSRYSSSKFIRYVYTQQNINESKYELDINQKTTGLLKGCGTYGDPYIIENAHQLSSLAAYIQSPGSVSKFQAIFNSKVLENQTQTAEGYHLSKGATSDATGTDIIYTWENGAWKNEAQSTADKKEATNYLLNAYYKIDNDITLSAENFGGLGTRENPFSGVIVGTSEDTTVALTGTNGNKVSFGGLIAYSRGSVVKDLIVDYLQATITMQADELPGISKNPFFGGVVGYCMGGDTIIDHVSVSYGSNSVSFSGAYEYMIAAGGYVGLVGGAPHITENTDYEKTGGGVVFWNMNGTTNSFSTTCSDANAANKTVNMKDVDANNKAGKSTSAGGDYFYRNPYVGRVLDGYACAEDCTVNNTDKNYTIPNLTAGTSDLQVTDASGSLNVTVTSAQGLWLLSAIVNSGAGAMDADGSYTDVDKQVVDAYQSGKPRTASYEGIGTATADAANLADEAYWGGVVSTAGSDTAKSRVSYLVKNYTTGNAVARLAGKSTSTDTNTPVMLTFETDSIDMSSYGNGFRGIGSSYGNNKHVWNNDCSIPEVYRRNLLIQSINTDRTEDTVITLNMNQNDYHTEYSTGVWRNQGAGLFVDFHFTNGCEVNHLQISGNIKLGLFGADSKLTYVTKRTNPEVHIGVGSFAARTANSSGTVTFNHFNLKDINVYGGTMTGGAIGYIDGYSGAGRNVSFTNWTIQNEKVTKWVNNDGSTGGLVGWNISYGTLTITGNEDSSVKDVDQLSVTTLAESFNTAAAGGLVGANDYSSVKVENVNAQNLSVSGKNLRDIGGLLAAGRKGGTLEVKKCSLASMKITLEINSNQKTLSACAGGIIGFHERPLTISEVMIMSDSAINGQQFTGGFVGYSAVDVTICNCREENINIKTDMNWIGGFIGYVNPNRTATFQNCQEENVNILGRYTGGLVGAMDGSIKASNIEFFNVIGVTYNDKGYAALLVGNTENNATNKYSNKVSGYNLLAKNCKFGYNNKAKVDELSTASIQQINTSGFWIGKVGVNGTVNLVAVALQGDVSPQQDIGTKNGNAAIIYADASVNQTYQPINSTDKPSSSASPWLDVNPKSDVPLADGTVMTGNGVGMQEGSTTASTILNGLQAETPASDVYWNLLKNKAEFVKFLDTTNDAYMTTYRKEESSTTTVSKDVDFPVLVVNNTADVDTMIWNYIAAMTNVSSGTDAKQQINSITATTYQWDTTKSSFAAKSKEDTSLSISNTKKISIVPNAYDNQNSQFTLLDVTYANPTNDKAPFHLYIPVLVKKVLYISFKTRFLAGTDYCAADYPMNDKATNHYATAGFDEPLTAYIEYSYEKDTDWQSMLDNGENLLWYYDKIMDLASGSTAASGKTLLPSGTRLTLVDRQTKQYYTYTTTGTEDLHTFNFVQMMTSDGKTAFCPVYICDLLDMKVSDPVAEETEGTTYYVIENDPKKATVRVGTTYYRKAEENDKNADKYCITIEEASKSEARSEGYYLTVQVPETTEYSMINNRLNYGAFSRKEGTLPAKITSDAAQSGSSYLIYKGVEQTFKISTSRVHNGSSMDDTIMENRDSIKIKIESTLKLTEACKEQFVKLGPAQIYHQFDVSLKKYLQEINGGEYDVIGTEDASYTYTLTGKDLNVTKEEKFQNVAGLDTLTIQYGGSDLKKALEKAVDDETAVTVTAEITLTYTSSDHFPERDTSNNSDDSGISVIAVSRIANTDNQLPITTNKLTQEDNRRYYTANPSKASLTYSSIDRTGIGDTTQQLGINPSDTVNNRSNMIYTRADYDYSNVASSVLAGAKYIRYSLELFQKGEDGTYNEAKPLKIEDYLQNLTIAESTKKSSYEWEEEFKADDARHQFTHISFEPLTDTAFEQKKYTYANYKVRLNVVLLDENRNEISGTKASDYVIYTNARIYQQIIQTN